MVIAFNKYQGTGNDFIIIDNRNRLFNPLDNKLVKLLCDRRFGIGADGLILISSEAGYDYRMIYFNSDGNESSMCGNGGRCAAAFAIKHSIAGATQKFMTFERGVEDETLSCGTGVTASAIAAVLSGLFKPGKINIETIGGRLSVEFRIDSDRVTDIWLCGPATFVFEGTIEM